MQNLQEIVKEVLKLDDRFISQDWEILKNIIRQKAEQLDENLIIILLENDKTREVFFKAIKDVIVFDSKKFVNFINNKEFLPDSYTSFKNKIWLANESSNYLANSNEIVLAWPYKDCVLAWWQDSEDSKRNEIFYNEILWSDEIDRLLDEKVFTNFKKYSKQGDDKCFEQGVATPCSFTRDENGIIKDNLIIKWNNLLALHSLKSNFAWKIKLIYIDPPYNTWNDGFKYNDKFNHSTWLTFMKNRLEIAKELLRDDWSIWVNLDDWESHYCKVLMDEIFWRENFISNIIWHKKNVVQNDARYFNQNHDHILVFSKNKEIWRPNLLERTDEMNERYSNPDNDPRWVWTSVALQAKSGSSTNVYEIEFSNWVKWKPVDWTFPRLNKNSLILAYDEWRLWFGKNWNNVPRLKKYLNEVKQWLVPNSIFSNDDSGSTQMAKEELKKLLNRNIFDTPKPEKLLKRIIEIWSKWNDLVLDFFSWSWTTCAVAHKMQRQYIGIEQMDYIHDLPEARLKKVIEWEQWWISKTVNWQGWWEFIYMEIMKSNEKFVEKIENVPNVGNEGIRSLLEIWDEIKESGFINYYVDIKSIDENIKNVENEDIRSLQIENMKRFLIEILDKNMLYVNYSEIEDESYLVSEEDKRVNGEFYKS